MDLSALTPLAGGWSGETFCSDVAGQRSVVRIYRPGRRDDAAPELDAAVLHLVRGLVPVAEVLEVRRGSAATDRPGLLVTSFLPGERGDLVLASLDESGQSQLGARLGGLAADLAGMPMLRTGPFVDPDLAIGEFGVADGLPAFVDDHAALLSESLGWDTALLDGLRSVCAGAGPLLDTVARACLVHSDFNPKNLLVDPDSLLVTGVLDWEYAHAGHPFTDLGNVLRFDRMPAYADAVLAAYCERRRTETGETLDLARAADLWALLDLAARRGQNPVADRAHEHLVAIARSGDLHALP